MKYFPNNTLAQFTTKLVKPLTLDGEWEVALVEILYPYSFHNTTKDCSIFVGDTVIPVPVDRYISIPHLLKVINYLPFFKGKGLFKFDPVSGRVGLKTTYDTPSIKDQMIGISDELDKILGSLAAENSVEMMMLSKHGADLDYFIPDQLFIYTDIVENQLVGDTSAPLLRTVAVTKADKNIQEIFTAPHYIKVQRRQFDTIDIDIRTRTGHPSPFNLGLVTCKLHFQKCATVVR